MAADVLPSGSRFSSTQMPAQTVKQLMKHHSTAAPKTKQLLENECDVILECRICLSLFRRSSDFITHKENYCKSAQNAVNGVASVREPGDGSEEADLSRQLLHNTPKSQPKIVSFDTSGARVEERRASVKIKNQIPPDRLPTTIPTNRSVLFKRELRSATKRALTSPSSPPPQPKKTAVEKTEKKPEKVVALGTTRFTPARLQEKREEPKLKEEKTTPVQAIKKESSVNRAVNTASPIRVKNNAEDRLEFDPDQYPTEAEEQTYQRVYQHVRSLVDLEALRCLESECDDFSNFQSIESLAYHLIVRHTKKCFFFQYHPCLLCNRKLRSLKSVWEHVANRHSNIYHRHKTSCDRNVTFPSMEFPDGFVPRIFNRPASDDEEETHAPAPQPKEKQVEEETADRLLEKCFSMLSEFWKGQKEQLFSVEKFNIRAAGMPPLQKVESVALEEFTDDGQEDSPPVLSLAAASDETESQDSAAESKTGDEMPVLENGVEEAVEDEKELEESDMSVDIINVSDEIEQNVENNEDGVVSEVVEQQEEDIDIEEEEESENTNLEENLEEEQPYEEDREEDEVEDTINEEDYPILEKAVEDEPEEASEEAVSDQAQEPESPSALIPLEVVVDSSSNSEGPPPLSPQSKTVTEEDRHTMIVEKIYTEDVCSPEGFEPTVDEVLERRAQVLAEQLREKERKKRLSHSLNSSNSSTASASSSITSPPDSFMVLGKRERKLPKRFEEHSLPALLTRDRERKASEKIESSKSSEKEKAPELERASVPLVPLLQDNTPPPLDRMITPDRRSPSNDQGRGSRIRRPPCWIASNDYVK